MQATDGGGWSRREGVAMFKRLGILGAVCGMLMLVVSMIIPAAAGGDDDGEEGTRYRSVTLRVTEKTEDNARFNAFVDVRPNGESVGDSFVIQGEPIFNAARTKRVGLNRGQCLIVRVSGGRIRSLECSGSFALPEGNISWEGPIVLDGTGRSTLAIVGGTGAYKTAHGTLHVKGTDEGEDYLFRLLL
jgi:hypothetical protein